MVNTAVMKQPSNPNHQGLDMMVALFVSLDFARVSTDGLGSDVQYRSFQIAEK